MKDHVVQSFSKAEVDAGYAQLLLESIQQDWNLEFIITPDPIKSVKNAMCVVWTEMSINRQSETCREDMKQKIRMYGFGFHRALQAVKPV